MRVLLSNKFYYRRGGDCVYTLNLEHLLQKHGHETAVFAMQYKENLPTPWSKYFPSEIKFSPGRGMLEALLRPFGTREVRQDFMKLIDYFQPDVVHLNNIHTHLSPVIAEIAYKRGIKVVWTLHDYKLLCPRYDCLRNGIITCEDCFIDKHQVLKYSCMKNSKFASVIAYREALKWNIDRLEACVDKFICPSTFMAKKMVQGGFDVDKLVVLCNFIDTAKCIQNEYSVRENYYCFIGRISHEKGIRTLIKAANELPYKLKIIGGGPMVNEMKDLAGENIEFVGFKQWNEIKELVRKSRFSVIPSEWYENNPLSVIESLCLGTPVLGSNIGGIPELIEEKNNGMTFISGNIEDLKDKIKKMFDVKFNYEWIAETSQKKYNADLYYDKIIELYKL